MISAAIGKAMELEGKVLDLTISQTGEAWSWFYEMEDRMDKIKKSLKIRVENGEEPVLTDGRHMKLCNTSSVKKTDLAKKKIAELCGELELAREIYTVPTHSVRPVGKKRKLAEVEARYADEAAGRKPDET